MSKQVNYFGSIPINPDNIPENSIYGQGSNRPLGFSFTQIYSLIYTVRSFYCSFTTTSQTDPLSQFLLGGGASAGILGATLALGGININGTNDAVTGYTKILTNFSQKERKGTRSDSEAERKLYTWDGIQNGKTMTKISVGNNQKTFNYINNKVYENNISSGNVHSMAGKVTIDFSNIKYYKKLYWPIIIISTNSAISNGSGPQLLGGISFLGGIINMYSFLSNPLDIRVAFGSINIGNRIDYKNKIFDRFLYDGTDYYEK